MTMLELSKIGRIEKEVEPIAGIKLKMHTLTVSEEQKINEYLGTFPTDLMSRIKPLQIETLVYSIESINETKFSDPNEIRTYLNTLQGSILDIFYTAYLELNKESTESIKQLKK